MIFYPEGLKGMDQNFMQCTVRRSMDAYGDNFGENSQIFFNAWGTTTAQLTAAIQSIPRHFKNNDSCWLHVFFICHGLPSQVVWARGKRIPIANILTALSNLQFPQLTSVSLLTCNALKHHPAQKYPYDLIGFVEYVYWNEMPFFLARMVKELTSGESMKKALRIAIKCCNCNVKTPIRLKDLFYQQKSNKIAL